MIPDDHSFLIITLKKFSFGTNLIDWIKIFLNDQESCVINGGVKKQYFKLEKGAQQRTQYQLFCLYYLEKHFLRLLRIIKILKV